MSREATIAGIVRSARECFSVSGAEATRMGEVAARAGVSRQYLYRLVATKAALIELALLARLRELGEELQAAAERITDDVAEALIDLVLFGVNVARDDREFGLLAAAMPRERLEWVLLSADSPVHAINARAFGSLFARALAAHQLRTDVSTEAIVGWLQSVMATLSSRQDLDLAAQRQLLREFVLPVVLVRAS